MRAALPSPRSRSRTAGPGRSAPRLFAAEVALRMVHGTRAVLLVHGTVGGELGHGVGRADARLLVLVNGSAEHGESERVHGLSAEAHLHRAAGKQREQEEGQDAHALRSLSRIAAHFAVSGGASTRIASQPAESSSRSAA